MPSEPGALRWLLALLAGPSALVLSALVASRIALEHPVAQLAAGVLAFACVCAEVLLAASFTPRFDKRALVGLAAPAALLALVAWLGPALPPLGAAVLVTLGLLTLGTLTGAVVGRAVEKPGHLVVVVVVSALVDVFSVLHPEGPTAQLVQVETVVSVLLLPWPVLGTSDIVPILGMGDITFAAIYLVTARQFGLSVRRTVVALAAGFAATLGVVLATEAGVPALPFLGVAMLVAHPEARRLPPQDRRTAAIGLVVIVALFMLVFALR
jgi:hypothetical protein